MVVCFDQVGRNLNEGASLVRTSATRASFFRRCGARSYLSNDFNDDVPYKASASSYGLVFRNVCFKLVDFCLFGAFGVVPPLSCTPTTSPAR